MAIYILLTIIAVFPCRYLISFVPGIIKTPYRLFFMGIIFLLYLYEIVKNKKIDPLVLICSIFSIYQVAICILKKGNIATAVYSNTIIAMSALLMSKLFYNYNEKLYLKISIIYFLVLNVLNLVTRPFLIDTHYGWLLGNRNHIFWYAFPLLIFVSIYSIKYLTNLKYIVLMLIYSLTIYIYCGSLTSLFSTIAFAICYYLFIYKKYKIPNLSVFLLIVLAVFVIFTLPGTNNKLFAFICKILGKDETASGRFELYEDAINKFIHGDVIFGNGIYFEDNWFKCLNTTFEFSHSTYLNIACFFGIIGLVLALIIILICNSYIKKVTNNDLKKIVIIGIFSMFIWAISENLHYYLFMYYLGILICFINYNNGRMFT